MKNAKRLKLLEEDAKYYDKDKKELEEIIKYINPKNKKILDVGAGIGRFAFPLAKKGAKIIAIDNDKALRFYYSKHKIKNLIFINKSIQEFSKETKDKFDVIIVSWLPSEFLSFIKKLSNKNTIIVTLIPSKKSDYDNTISKFVKVNTYFKEESSVNKDYFKVLKKVQIKINIMFPNKREAVNSILADLKVWWDKKLDYQELEVLKKDVENHRKGKEFIFTDKTTIKFIKLK